MPGPSAQGWPAVIAQSWVCSIWDTHRSDNMIQGGERQYSPRARNLLHIGEESDNVLVGVVFPGCRSTCAGHKPSKRLTSSSHPQRSSQCVQLKNTTQCSVDGLWAFAQCVLAMVIVRVQTPAIAYMIPVPMGQAQIHSAKPGLMCLNCIIEGHAHNVYLKPGPLYYVGCAKALSKHCLSCRLPLISLT